jgi:hypothetical protein
LKVKRSLSTSMRSMHSLLTEAGHGAPLVNLSPSPSGNGSAWFGDLDLEQL